MASHWSLVMLQSFSSLIKKIWQRIRRQQQEPLQTNLHDIRLLHHVRKCFFPKPRQVFHVVRLFGQRERQLALIGLMGIMAGLVWIGIEFTKNNRIQVPVNGGKYVEAVVGSPQFINPIFASTNDVDMDIVRLVYSGLMRYDAKHRLVPDLAVKYDISEDKKVYTFTLRQDVVWHDGEPFTAHDVVFTFESAQNPLVNSPLQISFQGVKVTSLDNYTVRFELTESFSPFLSSLALGILPEHVWFDIPPEQMRLASLNLQPVGTGPFEFKKLSKDETGYIYSYELTAFDRHYHKEPYLEELVFQFYPEYEGDSGAIGAFRGQKVQGLSFVPQSLKPKVERKYSDLHILQLPQYTGLFFNQDNNPILKDGNVRLALAHAVDKQRILQQVLNGEGNIIHSPILPGFPGYDPEVAKVNLSYEKANGLLDKDWQRISAEDFRAAYKQRLLKEWEDEEKKRLATAASSSEPGIVIDTTVSSTLLAKTSEEIDKKLDQELQAAQTFYRQNKEGKVLELSIVTTQSEEYKQAAGLIAGFWESIGVKTNLQFFSPKDFSREALKSRKYDVLLYGEIIGDDPDQYPFWHSSQIDYPGLNLSRYVNRNADVLIEKARESTNEEDVIGLYKKFQEILISELPAIFLYIPTYTYVTTNDIKGMEVVRISHPSDRFADVSNWYIKTDGQWDFNKEQKE